MNLLDCNKHFSLVETRPVTSPQHDVHPLYMRRDRSRLYKMVSLCCALLLMPLCLFSLPFGEGSGRGFSIYEAVRTPYKYGLVLAPQRNDEKFDCPSVFREGKKWLMTYVRYNGQGGTDGRQRPSRRQVRQRTAKGRQQGCRPILWSVHGSASLLSGLSYHSSGRTRKYFAFCRTKCCPTN